MRWKTLFISSVLLIGAAAVLSAADQGVWIGRQFTPRQCLAITTGAFDVKRKLCNIRYVIQPQGDRYRIDARLRFDETFIPDKVSDVELEILLMDENRVCTRQLNQRHTVQGHETRFTFVADKVPGQRYVRTYYIIYYK